MLADQRSDAAAHFAFQIAAAYCRGPDPTAHMLLLVYALFLRPLMYSRLGVEQRWSRLNHATGVSGAGSVSTRRRDKNDGPYWPAKSDRRYPCAFAFTSGSQRSFHDRGEIATTCNGGAKSGTQAQVWGLNLKRKTARLPSQRA
jgi:hypothetical protein